MSACLFGHLMEITLPSLVRSRWNPRLRTMRLRLFRRPADRNAKSLKLAWESHGLRMAAPSRLPASQRALAASRYSLLKRANVVRLLTLAGILILCLRSLLMAGRLLLRATLVSPHVRFSLFRRAAARPTRLPSTDSLPMAQHGPRTVGKSYLRPVGPEEVRASGALQPRAVFRIASRSHWRVAFILLFRATAINWFTHNLSRTQTSMPMKVRASHSAVPRRTSR